MKLPLALLFAGSLIASGETQEQINKRFTVEPGGKLVVDVDFGAVEVSAGMGNEVAVDVFRKVSRRKKADEEAYLRDHPVTFSQEGQTITVRCPRQRRMSESWRLWQRNEAKYTITVPAQFNADLNTSGGAVAVSGLTGDVKSRSSGGSLKFNHLHGNLDGGTSGGGIHLSDCNGKLRVETSGGGIDVQSSSGTLDGNTSGGHIVVRNFQGPVGVNTSGGSITLENIAGQVTGSTSGGSISARFSAPVSQEVKLETSGGGVTVEVPQDSAFNLDASTSGGGVSSELPVTVSTKIERSHLKGPVNGGGKTMLLRTSGGSIHVKKL